MVEHLDSCTQVLCEVCVCCWCSALPRVSHSQGDLWLRHHMHHPARQTDTCCCCLHAIIQCKVHNRGCEEIISLLSRPLSSRRFGIAHVLDRWKNKVILLSLNPYETVTIESDAFLSCESVFQQRRPTDDHLSPPYPLFPLTSDSLECSPMTLPCQSQHH